MTKWHVDLLMSHLAVYSLIADNFSTDIWDLAQDVGLRTKDFKQYFFEIGAKCAKLKDMDRARAGLNQDQAQDHLLATLKLPIEFPKQRVIPQGKGRR